ncbi:hypothetical protein E3N88_01578 [Mikania micrantha]|uniref:Retrotransposon gag domain-containing protein n=1 Tax=Mikania micrantha TaxID=192012 RepID=A0A5N6Q1K3_9ASTR|nr:hypothetical protein E3N88_01578 [Mikania micrantha]
MKVYVRKKRQDKSAAASGQQIELMFGISISGALSGYNIRCVWILTLVPLPGNEGGSMVATRNQEGNSGTHDPIAAQLEAIAAKLDAMESLKEDVAALKRIPTFNDRHGGGYHEEGETSCRSQTGNRPFNKIDFPNFGGGDSRGWILKAEKYFRYYHIPEDEKVDIASMHLDGDALDLFSWLSVDHRMMFWEDLTHAFQKNFGPAEFQNPDEFLCSIKQTGTVQEYRQEFAKRSARVQNWPDHCLLGVFLNGLKDELKADVRIHKPHTVYNAMSLAMEFESKVSRGKSTKGNSWNTFYQDILCRSKTWQDKSAAASGQQIELMFGISISGALSG